MGNKLFTLQVRIDRDLYKELSRLAERHNMSMSEVARHKLSKPCPQKDQKK